VNALEGVDIQCTAQRGTRRFASIATLPDSEPKPRHGLLLASLLGPVTVVARDNMHETNDYDRYQQRGEKWCHG
jgi:hypothetical protein